jgi:general secretion pathway protein A
MSHQSPVVPSPHGHASSQVGRVARFDTQRVEPGPTVPDQIVSPEAARSSAGQPGSLTYEPYYGLTEKPFSLSADPRFLYKSRSHAPAFNDLIAAIRRREGLIVLTGDIGTGKTTLCRSVLANLDRKTFSSFVPDPFMSREDLLKMLLIDFGVMSVDDLKSGRLKGVSRLDLSYPLYEFLDSLVPLEGFAVLIIDEAQNLSLSLLEEVRILSELERREKLLQVVLVGQLELQSFLKLPQMRQVDQRVSMRCELAPLARDGVAGYVTHRLNVAGGEWERSKNRFSPTALDVVFQVSAGVPRLINLICDRALQRGYLNGMDQIEPEIIWNAVADLGLNVPPASEKKRPVTNVYGVVPHDVFEKASAEKTISMDDIDSDLRALFESGPPMPRETDTTHIRAESAEPVSDTVSEWPTESRRARTATGRSEYRRESAQEMPRRRALVFTALLLVAVASVIGGSLWYNGALRPSANAQATVPKPSTPTSLEQASRVVSQTQDPPDQPPRDAVPETPAANSARASDPIDATPYLIQVASFESSVRAVRLVDELAKLGFLARSEEVDSGQRGRLQRVLVSGYRTRAEAESDLERIREIPGYNDARIIEPPQPSPALDGSLSR